MLFAGQEPLPPETGIEKVDGRWFGSSRMTIAGVHLRLVYFGWNRQTGHHSFAYHRHDFAEFAMTLRGQGQMMVGEPGQETILTCRPGDIYVIPGTVRHGARWDCAPSDPWEILLFHFELNIENEKDFFHQDQSLALQFAPFYEYFFLQKRLYFQLSADMKSRAFRSAATLRDSLTGSPDLAPVALLNSWLWIIAHISRALKQIGAASGDGLIIPMRLRDQRMERARSMLTDPSHWRDPMPSIARAVGMSLYHFIREFRARYGVPPMHYRNDCIMQAAGRLLAHSDEPIYLIAEKCAYDSPSAFAKAFQRSTGLSPLDYRNRYSNKEPATAGTGYSKV